MFWTLGLPLRDPNEAVDDVVDVEVVDEGNVVYSQFLVRLSRVTE